MEAITDVTRMAEMNRMWSGFVTSLICAILQSNKNGKKGPLLIDVLGSDSTVLIIRLSFCQTYQ